MTTGTWHKPLGALQLGRKLVRRAAKERKTTSMECNPGNFNVVQLVEAWNNASLKINDEYQRGRKWKLPQKQALIDSIFREYPIPPLFLHKRAAAGLGGEASIRYEVVDGQQRIRALAEYLRGDFPLLDPTDRRLKLPKSLRQLPAPWAKKYFADLAASDSTFLKSKKIDAFVIGTVNREDEVRDLFIRLQAGTALSRQEVRDAWPGSLGPYIEKLAGKISRSPSVKLFQFASKAGTRPEGDGTDKHEQDRQFCAQLLCLFLARENDRCSVQSVSANDLDKLYHENTEFVIDGPSAQRFEEILAQTTKILESWLALSAKARGSRRKKSKLSKFDVIAAFLLVQDLSRNKLRKIEKTFYGTVAKHLASDREKARPRKSTSGAAIKDYYDTWRLALLPDIGIQLDPRRAFDEVQKEAIFKRDGGICQICKKPVDDGEDEYDHFPERHEFGGRTEIDNGRLVCKACHPRGRLPISEEEEDDDDAIASVFKGYEKLGPEDRGKLRRPLKEFQQKFEMLTPEDQQELRAQLRERLGENKQP